MVGVTTRGKELSVGTLSGEHTEKIASDDLRYSNDAEVSKLLAISSAYTKYKRIIFTDGIKGNLRIKFDMSNSQASCARGKLYKNDAVIGAVQTGNATPDTYFTYSQDLDVGTMGATNYLDVYCSNVHTENTNTVKIRNFRVYHADKDLNAVAYTVIDY